MIFISSVLTIYDHHMLVGHGEAHLSSALFPVAERRLRVVFIPKAGRADMDSPKAHCPISLTSFQLLVLESHAGPGKGEGSCHKKPACLYGELLNRVSTSCCYFQTRTGYCGGSFHTGYFSGYPGSLQ